MHSSLDRSRFIVGIIFVLVAALMSLQAMERSPLPAPWLSASWG